MVVENLCWSPKSEADVMVAGSIFLILSLLIMGWEYVEANILGSEVTFLSHCVSNCEFTSLGIFTVCTSNLFSNIHYVK